jgi:hypothetical protein
MSVQFRSRIKSSADYSNMLSNIGACCLPDGSKSELTYNECISDGGYFTHINVDSGETIDDIVCPSLSSKGCCCSCNYVDDFLTYLDNPLEYSGGLQDNISFCECNRIGGIWAGENVLCSVFDTNPQNVRALCTNSNAEDDVRTPMACCVDLLDGTYDCQNVCSESSCSDLQPDGGEGEIWPEVSCGGGSPPECGTAFRSMQSDGGNSVLSIDYPNIIISKEPNEEINKIQFKETTNQKDGMVSACVSNLGEDCQLTSKYNCDGCWMGLKIDGTPYNCNDSEVTIVNTFLKTGKISRSDVESFNIGEYHIAGRYIGIYNGGGGDFYPPIEGLGNPKTGRVQPYTLEPSNKKELKSFLRKQYMVVLADDDFTSVPIEFDKREFQQVTSNGDSMFNMRGTAELTQQVSSKFIANGIGGKLYPYGWVIPSLDLTAFIYKQINTVEFVKNASTENNNPANHWNRMINKIYWTSTLFSGSPLVYVQSFIQDSIVSASTTTMKNYVRPALLVPIKN